MGWFDGASDVGSSHHRKSSSSKHHSSHSHHHHSSSPRASSIFGVSLGEPAKEHHRSHSHSRSSHGHDKPRSSAAAFFGFPEPSRSHSHSHDKPRGSSIFGGGDAKHNSSRSSFFGTWWCFFLFWFVCRILQQLYFIFTPLSPDCFLACLALSCPELLLNAHERMHALKPPPPLNPNRNLNLNHRSANVSLSARRFRRPSLLFISLQALAPTRLREAGLLPAAAPPARPDPLHEETPHEGLHARHHAPHHRRRADHSPRQIRPAPARLRAEDVRGHERRWLHEQRRRLPVGAQQGLRVRSPCRLGQHGECDGWHGWYLGCHESGKAVYVRAWMSLACGGVCMK